MDHPSNLRDYSALKEEKFKEENVSTPTSTEQVTKCLFYWIQNIEVFLSSFADQNRKTNQPVLRATTTNNLSGANTTKDLSQRTYTVPFLRYKKSQYGI